jgi:protein-disulfide isomerase
LSWRLLAAVAALSLFSSRLSTCRSPGENSKSSGQDSGEVVELAGVDTSNLTSREQRDWSAAVGELLSPCPDQPVTLAECVKESRPCAACKPAASFLVKQVQKGKTRAQIDTAYKKRFAADQVKDIPLDQSPVKGPAEAPITIIEFADFECSGCAAAYPVIEKLFKRFPNQVRLAFKNYPLSIHKHAEGAARAAMAANKQGKFWEMHGRLFKMQPAPPDQSALDALAKDLGLDLKKFKDDSASEAVADEVAKDRKLGDKLDLKSTPLLYINGRHFDIAMFDYEDLDEWIKLDIELKTGKKYEPKAVKDEPEHPAPAPSGASLEAPSASASAGAAPPPSGKKKAGTPTTKSNANGG